MNRTKMQLGWAAAIILAGVLHAPCHAQGMGDSASAARHALVITLDNALAMALDQNRDVMIAEKDRYRADAQVREAWAGALPQLTLTGQYVRNIKLPVLFIPPNSPINPTNSTQTFELGSDNSYALTASFSQTLFSQKVGTALDIAHTFRDYSEEAYRGTQNEVTLAVKKAFYGVLLAGKLVEATREGLDVVRANLDNVRSQYTHGNAAEFDLLRAEVQVANTEPQLISAENTLVLARNALKNLLAISLETDLEVSGDFAYEEIPQETLDEARRSVLTTNPMLRQLGFQESILEKNVSVERADYFPTLNLTGQYQIQTQDNSFVFNNYLWAKSFNVGLQMTFPIFSGFRTGARTEQAIIDRDKVHFQRLKAEEGIRIQVQSSELKMAEAKKRIVGQERNIAQAEKAVRIAQTRYRSGVGTQLELLDAQVAMTRARTNYAQAIFDFLIARSEWEYAVGQNR